jgi:hypothetical protein
LSAGASGAVCPNEFSHGNEHSAVAAATSALSTAQANRSAAARARSSAAPFASAGTLPPSPLATGGVRTTATDTTTSQTRVAAIACRLDPRNRFIILGPP